MSYDDWKCSPPCPVCGTPNCYCDESEPEEEPEDEMNHNKEDKMITKEQLERLCDKLHMFSNAKGVLGNECNQLSAALTRFDTALGEVVAHGKAMGAELQEFPFTNDDKPLALEECDTWIAAGKEARDKLSKITEMFADVATLLAIADDRARTIGKGK